MAQQPLQRMNSQQQSPGRSKLSRQKINLTLSLREGLGEYLRLQLRLLPDLQNLQR